MCGVSVRSLKILRVKKGNVGQVSEVRNRVYLKNVGKIKLISQSDHTRLLVK